MLYEALGSGAPTGLLQVARRKQTRIGHGVDRMIEHGIVTPHAQWLSTRQLSPPPRLDEAGRCAEEILQRWPTGS
jgi:hypothetical protein